MKPLTIEQQIKVLKRILWTPDIYGMCRLVKRYARKLFDYTRDELVGIVATQLIPLMNHKAYQYFYYDNRIVEKYKDMLFWDSPSPFGRIRRRIYVYHLIKELKKQLK